MEKIFVENIELEIPAEIVEDFQVFKSVINEETWDNMLTHEEKLYLSSFLPHFNINDAEEKGKTLKLLFSGADFAFENPLRSFHSNLKEGLYNPTISKLKSECQRLKEEQDEYNMKLYYEKLLCDAVVKKQKILDKIYKRSTSRNNRCHDHPYTKDAEGLIKESIHYRVNEKCLWHLKEIKDKVGDKDVVSSDDDDNNDHYHHEKINYFSCLPSTEDDKAKMPVAEKEGFKPPQNNGMMKDDFNLMLKKHRKRKRCNPKLPEFDTSGLSLDDIMNRAEFSKRPKLILGGSKTKRGRLGMEADPTGEAATNPNIDPDDQTLSSACEIKVEQLDCFGDKMGRFECFFSLIKECICSEQGRTILLNKLEDKIKLWQRQASSIKMNLWFVEYHNWSELVLPALKFLAGEMEGTQLDDFDPPVQHLNYQTWSWKADSNCEDELSMLYYHWMGQRNHLELNNSLVDLSAPIPPPRMPTDYIVRSSNQSEKEMFRAQELHRFTNPHKAFTYRLHGYESVVGPIKGVYDTESGTVKAREHVLLVNERPSCVNILTLVHDSAARLPNGEGTRSDICELLKDSQFLGAGVNDNQINTIVSGALDRLHYERDPCVKYDNARKVWIYRHRHRSEAEFERIHQMQRASVKAKKLTYPRKGALSKLQLSILKQKEITKHQGRSLTHATASAKISATSDHNQTITSPSKLVKPQLVVTSPLPSTNVNLASALQQPQQQIHTVLQLPDGSIIKTNSNKQPGVPVRMTKISTTSASEKTYSLLTNRTFGLKSASNVEQEVAMTTQTNLQSIISSTITSPLKTDANQLRLISQIQKQLLQKQQQHQQTTLVNASKGNLPSSIRPGIQYSTTVTNLLSNQKISGLVANPNNLTSKPGTIPNNYVSHLLRGNTIVLPSSTSGQTGNNLQGLICVSIAGGNLTAQLNQGGLVRNQSSVGNIRVLSLPAKVLVSDQQHAQKNILIGNSTCQTVNQAPSNAPAIYLATNVHGKPMQDAAKSLPTSSIINPQHINLAKSLSTVPQKNINPSISLLSSNDVRVAIMRPRLGQDQRPGPQVLQARLPTSLQGFFQIVSRPHLSTPTTTPK